jgi:CheY-like chemotaxis protein
VVAKAVMIVSTDQDTQDLYVHALRARRRKAYGTTSLAETVRLAREDPPAAIVVDVRGAIDWRACRGLRREPITRDVPLIALTGWVAPDHRFRNMATRLGCAAYLLKPSLPDTLHSVVERVIGGETGIEVLSLG